MKKRWLTFMLAAMMAVGFAGVATACQLPGQSQASSSVESQSEESKDESSASESSE